jgi:hypothetical protein
VLWKLPLSGHSAYGSTCCRLDPLANEPGADMGALPGNAGGATAGHSSCCFRNSLVCPSERFPIRLIIS